MSPGRANVLGFSIRPGFPARVESLFTVCACASSAKKRAAFSRKLGLVRLTIRETLALGTFESHCRTFSIVKAKRNAVIVPEVILREVAV